VLAYHLDDADRGAAAVAGSVAVLLPLLLLMRPTVVLVKLAERFLAEGDVSVLCLSTELVRYCELRTEYLVIRLDQCFVLGPNWFGDTTAAPNIWQFIFFGALSNDRTVSLLWLTTELFRCYSGCTEYLAIRFSRCFILGPNSFGALS
jgi:hypothetical protein